MTQWEYATDTMRLGRHDETVPRMNARGLDGWELVTLSESAGFVVLYWKRPLSTPWQDAPGAKR